MTNPKNENINPKVIRNLQNNGFLDDKKYKYKIHNEKIMKEMNSSYRWLFHKGSNGKGNHGRIAYKWKVEFEK